MDVHTYDLNIADVQIRIRTDRELEEEPSFAPFLNRKKEPDYTADFRQVQQLPPMPRQILYQSMCDRVHPDESGVRIRSFFDEPRGIEYYALGRYDDPGRNIQIDYLAEGAHCVSQMSNSFYHIGIEALMQQEGKFFFHAAFLHSNWGGILFSGPSGIGKSTQAALWCKHRGARLLNGDRPILGKANGVWTAWGAPYAGSSRCYVDESRPIAGIIMLRQAPVCTIRRLSRREAYRSIYAGLTVNSWNPAFSLSALDFAVALAGEIPVYELCCTPDEAAVVCLEEQFRKDLIP